MNFATQIKCTVAALALFTALGFAALTRAETVSKPSIDDVVHTRIEVGAPVPVEAEMAKIARVHVGTPVMVDANPSAEDVARASR